MKNKTRTTIITVVTMIILVAAIIIAFIFVQKRLDSEGNVKGSDDSDVEELIKVDFENDYPPTAHEVLRYYSRFLKCYYNEKLSDEQVELLAEKNHQLFDEEVIKVNPLPQYINNLKNEIEQYKKNKITMVNWNVQNAADAKKEKKGDNNIINLKASFFLKSGKNYTKTYEVFHLREDSDGNWKILSWEITNKF